MGVLQPHAGAIGCTILHCIVLWHINTVSSQVVCYLRFQYCHWVPARVHEPLPLQRPFGRLCSPGAYSRC